MDGLFDRASPRRGSLTSLHRQPSGSFSHGSKHTSPAGTLQVNNANLYSLCKDLDKFTRYFIIKTVQVIVQSRISGNRKVKTDCKPSGNDWFNINIPDIAEISEKTKAVLDTDGFSVKSNWRVCCEISLRTNDGGRVVLEHWIFSNKSNFTSNPKLNSSQASPRGYLTNRSSTSYLTSSNNGGATMPLSSANSTIASGRVRPSTFSHSSRTRLNSIDDCTGDNNFAANKLLMGVNNENIDIKSSTSCFSLSSAPTNQHVDPSANITNSPSINSLNNNAQDQSTHSANGSSTQSQQQQGSSKSSSIYTTYNKMSLLLKTIMTTTHIVPAYRLASRSSTTDSCVICYRVYASAPTHKMGVPNRGSIEDVSYSESPNKRSLSSNSSFGSVNIRDYVGLDELDHFCPVIKLGAIKTDVNELEVSVCYRTDMHNSNHLLRSPQLKDAYHGIMDEDCIVAAKQLLAGNACLRDGNHTRAGSANNINQERNSNETLNLLDQPLKPAFASSDLGAEKNAQDSDLGLIESVFDSLLRKKCSPNDEQLVNAVTSHTINHTERANGKALINGGNAQSAPIQVPSGSNRAKNQQLSPYLSAGSTPKSLTDSYVFVDLNPPFASEEQNDINSFFHGPSPAFNNASDSLKDVDELTNQLAVIEANASQFDEFIDNICVSEDEEEA